MRVKLLGENNKVVEELINKTMAEIEETGYVLDVRFVSFAGKDTAMIMYEERPDEAAEV